MLNRDASDEARTTDKAQALLLNAAAGQTLPIISKTSPTRRLDRRMIVRDQAARIFAERGYHGASLQEVADAVGFTKASIYYYYKGKEELLFDILTFAHEEISALFALEAEKRDDPLTHVGRLVAVHVTWYLRHPMIAKVAFRDWTALNKDLLAIQTERRREHSHALRDGIEICRREGLISRDAKVGIITNFINGAVAASNVWFKPEGAETPETVGAAFGSMAIAVLLDRMSPETR